MLTREQTETYRESVARLLSAAGVVVTPEERANLEIADLGLGDFPSEGLTCLIYVDTDRYCAKEIVLLPRQTCAQHRHPPVGSREGKMETFRCRWGEVYLYLPGEPTANPCGAPPAGSRENYTVLRELVLRPGEQYTIPPDTWHWFQAGPAGAVVSEFSSPDTDEFDVFLDPRIRRAPEIAGE